MERYLRKNISSSGMPSGRFSAKGGTGHCSHERGRQSSAPVMVIRDFQFLGLFEGEAESVFFWRDKVQSPFDCRNVLEECRK